VLLGFKLPEAAADGLQQVAFAARTDMDSQRETDAALRIQSYYRGFRCRKTVNGSHTDVCTQATCTGDKLRRRAARIQETLLVCCFPFNMGKHCEDHLDRLRRWTWAGSTYQLLCRRPSVHVGIEGLDGASFLQTWQRREQAAMVIQKHCRGWQARMAPNTVLHRAQRIQV
jgi:IQ calmodulin-binding motif